MGNKLLGSELKAFVNAAGTLKHAQTFKNTIIFKRFHAEWQKHVCFSGLSNHSFRQPENNGDENEGESDSEVTETDKDISESESSDSDGYY